MHLHLRGTKRGIKSPNLYTICRKLSELSELLGDGEGGGESSSVRRSDLSMAEHCWLHVLRNVNQ